MVNSKITLGLILVVLNVELSARTPQARPRPDIPSSVNRLPEYRHVRVLLPNPQVGNVEESQAPGPERVDLLIRGGCVFDGSSNPWQYKNVGIQGDRIVWLGDATSAVPPATRTLDVKGLYLAPGFIDLHSHTAEALGRKKLTANQNYLYQGVTTVVTGNDGSSPWPIAETLKGYEGIGIGPNAVLLVGHGTVRQKVLGMGDRAPTREELDRMKKFVRQGMREGAFGMSTGLYYAPGSYAQTSEVIALAQEVQKLGGFFDSHIRDESDYSVGLLRAIQEVVEIGRTGGLPVHVSHIKALGPSVWGKSQDVIDEIEKARREGIDITANQYPYDASGTSISGALVPRWAQALETQKMPACMQDATGREKILSEVEVNIRRRGGADKLVIASFKNAKLEGKSLQEIAALWKTTPAEAALKILEQGGAGLVSFNMRESDIRDFMRRDWVATASDGNTVPFGQGKPHPRGYGTFPRKIQRYVLEQGIITLPFAIRAATSLPASIARIPERGWIRERYYADIVIFNLAKFRESATYQNPHQYASGVEYLIINGTLVIENGKYNGKLAGKALRSSTSAQSDPISRR